jgi:hypothetical protein
MDLRRKNKDTVRAVVHNPQVDGENKKNKNRGKKEKKNRRKEFANPELAARLRDYGEGYGLEEDPYLEGLSNAIEEGKNLSIWASNDVMTLMPHPDVASVEGPIYSAMVLFRNVLVFVPVALTWLAVGKATTGFSLYTTKSSAASVVNFLQFWQNGYGVLAKAWTLSQVAEDDFYIIAAVIFLTFVTPFMNRSAVKRAAQFEQDALRERLTLVIEVESFLFDRRRLTPLTIDSALAHSFERVVDATHNLMTASNAIKVGISSLSLPVGDEYPPNRSVTESQQLVEIFDQEGGPQRGTSKKEKYRQQEENWREESIEPSQSVISGTPRFSKRQTEIVENAAETLKTMQKRMKGVVESLPQRTHARKELKKIESELEHTRAQLVELRKNLRMREKKAQKQSEWRSAKQEAERKKALAGFKNFNPTSLRLVEDQ